MSKRPTVTTINSSYASQGILNTNFTNIEEKFDNTLSLDGSSPNQLSADIDLNGNDLLNARNIEADTITIDGTSLGGALDSAGQYAAQASDSADEAAVSAAAALVSQLAAEAVEDSLLIWLGPWLTSTFYDNSNIVSDGGSSYICIVPHTSGVFVTDLLDGKWELFAEKGATGAGTGDVLAANSGSEYTAASATFRSNIGLGSASVLAASVNPDWAVSTLALSNRADTKLFVDASIAAATETLTTSGLLTLPINSVTTWAHGLGAAPDPDRCGFYLVWKGGSTNGFIDGDLIQIAGTADDDANGLLLLRNSTNLRLALRGTTTAMTNALGSNTVNLSASNVSLVFWVRA